MQALTHLKQVQESMWNNLPNPALSTGKLK
jgi:hypothetical protein